MIRVFRFIPLLLLLFLAHVGASQPLPDRFPLRGVAVDNAGKPLAGAIISLRRQDEGGSYVFWGAETATDARGAFQFGFAEVGRYYLSAEAAGFAPIANQVVGWKSGDKPLQLRLERLVTLPLQIFAPDNPQMETSLASPLANALVWVRLRGEGRAAQITRRALFDGEGKISLQGLLPATYSLYLATPRGYAIQKSVTLRDDSARRQETLRVNLQAGGALTLSVAQSGDAPRSLGGAVLNLSAADATESTRLLGEWADPNENFALLAAGGDFPALTSRDGDGTIEISNLPPGNYLARLRLPFHTMSEAQNVTIGAHQTTHAAFEATPAEANQSALTLNLRRSKGANKGANNVDSTKNESATGGEAASGEFSLRFLPLDQKGAPISEAPGAAFSPGGNAARRAIADQRGQITIFPIRVGRYRVFVAPRALPGEEREDAPDAVSIDIDVPASGATATLELPSPTSALDLSLQ